MLSLYRFVSMPRQPGSSKHTATSHFFTYLSFYSVHGPIQTSRDRWQRFRDLATRSGSPPSKRRFIFDRNLPVRQAQDCPIYGGMIEAMDATAGLVMDALDCNGLTERTIVCVTSDNGGVSSGDCYSTTHLSLRGGRGGSGRGMYANRSTSALRAACSPGTALTSQFLESTSSRR